MGDRDGAIVVREASLVLSLVVEGDVSVGLAA